MQETIITKCDDTKNNLYVNLVVFDFCNTLVNFETADRFVEFVCDELSIKCINNALYTFFIKGVGRFLRIFNDGYILEKRLLLKKIRGISKRQIDALAEKYYINFIKPNLLNEMINKLIEHEKRGDFVCVVSAAYVPYLNYFKCDYDIKCVIANDFLYDDEQLFTGDYAENRECIGDEKVCRLYNFLESNLKCKYKITYSYGDSKSDIPILRIADVGVLVIHNKRKFKNHYGFKEVRC